MKRSIVFIMLLMVCLISFGQGIPFMRNYKGTEYGANNRNFDIIAGENGMVYAANFEGLLYYDNAEWRILYTPGITRITFLFRDSKQTIWAGGYNYIGCLTSKENGELALKTIGEKNDVKGEVERIWEADGNIYFHVSGNQTYVVRDNQIQQADASMPELPQLFDLPGIVPVEILQINNHLFAVATKGRGIIFINEQGYKLFDITEENGLCSNNVNNLDYNGHGILWCATDNGICAIGVPSIYSHFTSYEGLRGEVQAIEKLKGELFVGTLNGVFLQKGMRFDAIEGAGYTCWQLAAQGDRILAATANGVYSIGTNGNAEQLTTSPTLSLLVDGSTFLSGELDGLYQNSADGSNRKEIAQIEKVVKILKDQDGSYWIQNMFGIVWKGNKYGKFVQQNAGNRDEVAEVIMYEGKVRMISESATTPFPYPLYSYTEKTGVTWLTNYKGSQLYAVKNGVRVKELCDPLFPWQDMVAHAMYRDLDQLWIGSENGLNIIDYSKKDVLTSFQPNLLIRRITLNSDSVLYGGIGEAPTSLPTLPSTGNRLEFYYSLNYKPLVGEAFYRYRLNNNKWSAWVKDTKVAFPGLPHGSYTLEIQVCHERETPIASAKINFDIMPPFYIRWYMNFLYVIIVGLVIWGVVRLRLRQLEKDKLRLEEVIQDRTAEVVKQRDEIVKQKDEIEEKSNSLEKALNKLNETQHELIRQEKMATVGKLTKGLIDRILNPLNYINNFSKLSLGLVKDIEANIEDDKDAMDKENYEDTVEVLDMLEGNLKKVSEHGQNTTRTLKAMEEMLKDRSGGMVEMDLCTVLRQDKEILENYYADDIKTYQIAINIDLPKEPLMINGNAEQLSKAFMSLLGNSVYALCKKAQRLSFQPEISVKVLKKGSSVVLSFCDNGVGIEQTIIEKVFDPFFTTKTTGEAAGVGLYLSREIVQNHGGDIVVESNQNEFTTFTITLPNV